MTPISLGIFASANTTVGTSFESIATVTVGSGGASNVEFTSIPGTYTHLQLRVLARDSRANLGTNLNIQFNSDTGTNYTSHSLYGDGVGATAIADGASQTSALAMRTAGNNSSTSVFGTGIIDILDYTNTNKYKTTRSLSGYDNNGSGNIYLTSGLWLSTNAITSIKLTPVTTPILQYSSFALYGIKVAA